ncbi:hypothetical protein [Asanoa siamensis]|uniref:BNR/Asp-box repeat protein n=1 Tax=Asanoa siamensis TaxID=926357 RepID=A0ABQ4CGW4_9ACTN|nr:hypothetical protein [Asanoa siamensis]GIF70533.1 hypothetical protein Asi02nite_00510 [Asanoa siamensis]
MPDLDSRLARSRADLLDEIEQPPLATVRRRATRIRRRRAVTAGAAALALLGVVAIGVRPWQQDTTPSVTATDPSVTAPVYRGGGIDIIGLSPAPVHGLNGPIAEVEFSDEGVGIAAAGCDRNCPPLARTTDGGLSWSSVAQSPTGDGPMDVIAFPAGHWLVQGDRWWSSQTGSTWQVVTPPPATDRAVIEPGELPRVDQPLGAIGVLSWDRGPLGPLATQPGLTARWVAPAPAGDGAWWVGGLVGTAPAVAVSRDSGRSWTTTVLPTPADPAETVTVSTLGVEVYAMARNGAGEVLGIYHSADGGKRFTPTFVASGGDNAPAPFTGDPVPLLDGRLLVIQSAGKPSSWWASADDGKTFIPIVDLPAASWIRRTYAGYVAYGLFGGSWAAFSTDGTNWQKLQLN